MVEQSLRKRWGASSNLASGFETMNKLILIFAVVVVFLPMVRRAEEPTTWTIDTKTTVRGVELGNPTGEFIIGVPPATLKQEATLGISPVALKSELAPKEWIVDAAY